MNDEKQDRVTAKLVRAILMDAAFNSRNALLLTLMVVHDISPQELEDKISEILAYIEKEDETG